MIAALFLCWMPTAPVGVTPELVAYVYRQADEYAIPRNLVDALAWAESGWNPYAQHVNPNGTVDRGLFQPNSRTWLIMIKSYNGGKWADPMNPYDNARLSLAYLADLHAILGSWHSAIAAYNAGIGSVWHNTVPDQTVAYMRRIEAAASM